MKPNGLHDTDLVMDMGQFNAMTDGDAAFRSEVVEMFMQILEESTPRLISNRLEFPDWCKEAHKLKGAALNIGATRLGLVCKAMEACANDDERAGLITAYQEELVALKRALGGLA